MIAPERGTKVTAYFEVREERQQKNASVHGAKG